MESANRTRGSTALRRHRMSSFPPRTRFTLWKLFISLLLRNRQSYILRLGDVAVGADAHYLNDVGAGRGAVLGESAAAGHQQRCAGNEQEERSGVEQHGVTPLALPEK